MDEAALVARARRGHPDGYRGLMALHTSIAFRVAFLVVGSRTDAEEVVQDAFVKAFRALGRFRAGSPFRPWLLAIVGNEARNRRRGNGVRPALPLTEPRRETPSLEPSPEARLLAAEERRALGEALRRLPVADRDALACRFFLDLTQEETAAVLGLPTGTVKSRVSRALDRLRRELADAA